MKLRDPNDMKSCLDNLIAGEGAPMDKSALDSGMRMPMRVGILLRVSATDSLVQILETLTSHTTAELAAVVRMPEQTRSAREPFLFWLWRRLHKMAGSNGNLPQLFARLKLNPEIIIDASLPGTSHRNSICDRLAAANLDVLIQIGGESPDGELARLAGRASYWVPDPSSAMADAAWFWSMYRNEEIFETVVVSQIDQCPSPLRSFAATHSLSLSRNRSAKLRKISDLILNGINRLNNSSSSVSREMSKEPDSAVSASLPGNREVCRFLVRCVVRAARHVVRSRLYRDHWFIAFRENPGSVPASAVEMKSFQIIAPAKDRFYADPFLISRNGKHYVFFEDYPFKDGKGVISYMEIKEQGICGEAKVALEREYHLSYPCIFEHQGNVYMVPESLRSGTVDLYRAQEFPAVWSLEKTLLSGIYAVDPTLFHHDGKFWLFVSGVISSNCINEDLHLYYADSLDGKWTPHPQNPIVSDVRRARPAGKLFIHQGQLIRPAQDCSSRYGRAVTFNCVRKLSQTEYEEEAISEIGPEWFPANRGTHTFNQNPFFQVTDGRVLIPRYHPRSVPPIRRSLTQSCSSQRPDDNQIALPAYSAIDTSSN